MPSGIGVQPVEGRWSAARWSGDPGVPASAGVWSGNLSTFVSVASSTGHLSRAAAAKVVRQDDATLKRLTPGKLVRRQE